ncbi:outer membrane beta-barrel protein [Lutibacter sp. A80]|uniref:outer membrane beta-barrel protein n=1 Tax=Lutibacter sp. A80 TaxID=2918453 RepID=UPI001F0583D1|nr:outer membrane beta-barrel protein [Lutibacter sp. A80]UMB59378.1 outer membrane beta-barrel protein [Lutibacter sp. A80]
MRDYKNIDRIFQEKLKDLEVSPPSQSWNSIQKKLAPVSQKKRFPLWLKFASVAALLILFFSIGTIYFIPHNNFSNNFLKDSNSENIVIDNDSIQTTNSKNNTVTKKPLTQPKINELIGAKSTKITAINSIDEVSNTNKNNNLKENNSILTDALSLPLPDNNDTKMDKSSLISSGRITVATIFAPIYISSFGDGSGIDSQFKDNPASGNSSYSYGVKFAYKLNNKFSVQSGINLINLGYTTNNIYVTPGVAVVEYSNISNNPINLGKPQQYATTKLRELNAIDPNKGSLNQVFGYVEIPVELKYNVTDGKLGVNLVGGFSTLLLNNDEVFVETNSITQSLGSSNNLRAINFTGNIGLDVDYSIKENLFINISPMFKMQTNTFSKNSGSIQPYYLGIYTGLNYKF